MKLLIACITTLSCVATFSMDNNKKVLDIHLVQKDTSVRVFTYNTNGVAYKYSLVTHLGEVHYIMNVSEQPEPIEDTLAPLNSSLEAYLRIANYVTLKLNKQLPVSSLLVGEFQDRLESVEANFKHCKDDLEQEAGVDMVKGMVNGRLVLEKLNALVKTKK